MAGETSGAERSRKKGVRKQLPNNSTDRIYASGNPSALKGSQTSDGKIHRTLVPQPKLKPGDERSTDRYYAVDGGARATTTTTRKKKVAPVAAVAINLTGPLTITKREDIFPIFNEVVARLESGADKVVVSIPDGQYDLIKRARAALDSRVTRQQITENQGRDVHIAYASTLQQALTLNTPPTPTTTVHVDSSDALIDPDAFLSGTVVDPLDETIDTSPVQEVVEISADGVTPVEAEVAAIPPTTSEEAADDDDDDGSDTPVAVVPPETTPVATEETPKEEAPKEESTPRRTRKGGRA